MRRDVAYALRMMRRNPGFAAAAIFMLALGIGANTAIFSLVDAVLVKRLPVAEPSELVLIDQMTSRGEQHDVSFPLFERLRSDPDLVDATRGVLTGLVAVVDGTYRVDAARGGSLDRASLATAQLVDGSYFSLLGVRPFLGRVLTREDDGRPGDARVAVLAHRFWTARFGGDPSVVGSTIVVKGHAVRVLGITAPEFFGESVGRAPDMWMPLAMQPALDGQSYLDRANVGWLRLIGRTRRDTAGRRGLAQVNAALDVVRARYAKDVQLTASDGSRGLEAFRVRYALPLRILSAMVGLVLLIVCANVSNLLLVRAMARRREMSIRLAIGAGRARIVGQLATESLVLAVIAGTIGLLVGAWGSQLLLVLASEEIAPSAVGGLPISLALDGRALAFTAALSLAAVAIFGLAPAAATSGMNVSTALKLTDGETPRSLMGRSFVIAQVALSMMLLTGAGLFAQTLHNLRSRDVGFAPDSLIEVDVRSTSSNRAPEQLADLTRRVWDRLRTTPGVTSVSFAHAGFGTGMSRTCCIAVDRYVPQPGELREVRMLGIGPDYFKTMALPLKEGRDFTTEEAVIDPNRLTVAIVNETFARRYLSGRSAVGARFGWGDPPRVRYTLEIVGVARDAVYDNLRETAAPLVYFPSRSGDTFVVRTSGPPEIAAPAIAREVAAADAALESNVRILATVLDAAVARERLLSRLAGFFGVLAMVLAAVGLYGLAAYGVARRTKEIGIRIALGADPRTLLRSEVRSAVVLVLIGLAAGIPFALAAASLVRSQLFGIGPADARTLLAAAALLIVIAVAAAVGPARRASRIDPIGALRTE